VFVEGHEAAGHEGVAAEDDRDWRFDRGVGEVAEEGVADFGPVAEIGEEAVFAGGVDAEVGEEDAGVDEGGVAELGKDLEEVLEACRFDEEAEEGAGGAGLWAAFGFEAALFGEETDAASGLALEVLPSVAADAARDEDLGFAVGEEREDALVSSQPKSLTRGMRLGFEGPEVVTEARAAFAGEGETGEIGGGVDVHLSGDGAREFAECEASLLFEGAGEGVVALEWLDRFENAFADGEGDEVGGEGVVGDGSVVRDLRRQIAEVVRAEERDAAAAQEDDALEGVAMNEVCQARAEVKLAFVDILFEAWDGGGISGVVSREDGALEGVGGEGGFDGVEGGGAAGGGDCLLDGGGAEVAEEDDEGGWCTHR
jgi:hypothetical protein